MSLRRSVCVFGVVTQFKSSPEGGLPGELRTGGEIVANEEKGKGKKRGIPMSFEKFIVHWENRPLMQPTVHLENR